jgi:hypothetical protein
MANERNDALKDYVEVNVRIERFWAKYPNGRISTEVNFVENTSPQEVITKAYVWRDIADAVPAAVGHAHEIFGSSYINRTSYIENSETSAIGRALAILGFEIKKSVASREEVANAKHQQTQQQKPAPQAPTASPAQSDDKPTPAQITMINAKLGKSGYTKADVGNALKVMSEFLGYEIKRLDDIKRIDISRLAEFLATHQKSA